MLKFIFSCLLLTSTLGLQALEKPFVIVVPSYNNSAYYLENLNSVFAQRYDNYRVIYVADGDSDGTAQLVEEFVERKQQGHRFLLLKNHKRLGPLASMCRAVHLCGPEEIVVDLDGNDWLAHEEVLSSLNALYADRAVWMTYGQFMAYPRFTMGFAKEVPHEIVDQNRWRSYGGAVTHLKTFYAGLFHEINKEDFLYEGEFISRPADLAYSIPLTELSGAHARFVPDVLYIYNRSAPVNENKKSDEVEERFDLWIRSKPAYQPLNALPFSLDGREVDLRSIYSQIADITHPTLSDYRFIQDFLAHGKRRHLERLKDMESRMRSTKIIGETPEEFPKSGTIPVNCSKEERGDCILLYSTFNMNYPQGLKRLLKHIVESDFKGHVLYRLGGWPDVEGGALAVAHVPYAFKPAFFREAKRLGYKRVLWLDTSALPLVPLSELFDLMSEKGCFVMENGHRVGPWSHPTVATYFGLTQAQTEEIPSCSAGLFGVDLTQEVGRQIVDFWYRAAQDRDAFFSARSDQNALSIILHQLGITNFIGLERLPHSRAEIKPDSLILLDREFVLYQHDLKN